MGPHLPRFGNCLLAEARSAKAGKSERNELMSMVFPVRRGVAVRVLLIVAATAAGATGCTVSGGGSAAARTW